MAMSQRRYQARQPAAFCSGAGSTHRPEFIRRYKAAIGRGDADIEIEAGQATGEAPRSQFRPPINGARRFSQHWQHAGSCEADAYQDLTLFDAQNLESPVCAPIRVGLENFA